jgi:O-acetyl-ADP-ribose deacetylase (regulator of RNase III)
VGVKEFNEGWGGYWYLYGVDWNSFVNLLKVLRPDLAHYSILNTSAQDFPNLITFIQGNLFETNAQVITNAINCVGVMGKGVALEFKRRYPELFTDYKRRCADRSVRVGELYLWEDESVQILNFPTKKHWKDPSRLEYIETGLRYLVANYAELGIHSIAMPQLGCGNGGLDWKIVMQMMKDHLGLIPDLEVYVYVPEDMLND